MLIFRLRGDQNTSTHGSACLQSNSRKSITSVLFPYALLPAKPYLFFFFGENVLSTTLGRRLAGQAGSLCFTRTALQSRAPDSTRYIISLPLIVGCQRISFDLSKLIQIQISGPGGRMQLSPPFEWIFHSSIEFAQVATLHFS